VFRSRSKEIATISIVREKLSSRKEVASDGIVRFIKVNGIDFNICLLNFVQGVISGEDNAGITSSASNISKQMNLICFSAAEVMSLTTVNVHHMNILGVNQLKELRAQLLSKQNARSNHNKGLTLFGQFHVGDCIFNHTNSLATTRRDDNLTFAVIPHRIDCTFLVRTKSDGQVSAVRLMNII
jgi:hypothetical protein